MDFTSESNKYLIACLGNIGEEYANTRHNIGFVVADALALALKTTFRQERYGAVAKASFKGRQLFVLKPSTFMNLSGKAVVYWLRHEKIPLANLLVVTDDISLPPGSLRMKKMGGDAGHNGMINIIEELQTTEFPRLRVGIGNDFARGFQVAYVLGKWTSGEELLMTDRVKVAVEMVKSFVVSGTELTMTRYNGK